MIHNPVKAIAFAVLFAGATSAVAFGALPAVTISPLPGTPDASPDTQISILGESVPVGR